MISYMKHILDHILYYIRYHIYHIWCHIWCHIYHLWHHIYHMWEAFDGWSDPDIASQPSFCVSRPNCAPLIPCFIGCNSHPTIPYRFKDDRRIGHASADTQRDQGNGSRLYEVNIWMWRYGRGRLRMVSIAEAEKIGAERHSESRTRAAETRKRRSEAAAAAGAAQADWTLANYIIHTQASFNTMRYKGRDSASGIDRKLSIIRPGATTIVVP